MQRSDVNAAGLAGWPAWPFRLAALAVFALSPKFVLNWQQATQQPLPLYRLPG